MSSLEFQPPKYARVVLELKRRIESGEYSPGAMLPSESQLTKEFAVGRTTVVRALELLKQEGWITREHGVGSFVKARSAAEPELSRPGLAVLDQAETAESVALVGVGLVEAPAPVVTLLGLEPGEHVVIRRWVTVRDGSPSDLVTCWFPQTLAYGTELDQAAPLRVGVRAHLRKVRDLRIDHIAERLTARLATAEEAEVLKLKPGAPVLRVLATMHDAGDRARFAAEVVMPGSRHELEDVYSVTG